MSQITTHVLDTSTGKPACGVSIKLFFSNNNIWKEIGKGVSGDDGRINNLLENDKNLDKGIYKMTFDSGSYFKNKGLKNFYPRVKIIFEVDDEEHYHIPLLLSPFGYSTYRGS